MSALRDFIWRGGGTIVCVGSGRVCWKDGVGLGVVLGDASSGVLSFVCRKYSMRWYIDENNLPDRAREEISFGLFNSRIAV